MNNQVRELLRNMVLDHGVEVLDDVVHCEAFVRQAVGQYRLETSALLSALREGVPIDLERSRASSSRRPKAVAFADRLENNQGLNSNVALWATEAWAYALDVSLQTQQEVVPVQRAITPPSTELKRGKRNVWKAACLGLVLLLGVLFWLFAPGSPTNETSVATVIPPAPADANAATEVSGPSQAQPVVPAQKPSPLPKPSEAKPAPVKATERPSTMVATPPVVTEVATTSPPIPPTLPKVVQLTIPTGATITIRTGEEVDSETVSVGDQVKSTIDSPVSIADTVAVPKGSAAVLRVAAVKKAGHFGRSEIKLQLVEIMLRNSVYLLESVPYDVKASRGIIVKKGKGLTIPANEELEFTLARPVTLAE